MEQGKIYCDAGRPKLFYWWYVLTLWCIITCSCKSPTKNIIDWIWVLWKNFNEVLFVSDHTRLFAVMCYACNNMIGPGDKELKAIGQTWHDRCFNCQVRAMSTHLPKRIKYKMYNTKLAIAGTAAVNLTWFHDNSHVVIYIVFDFVTTKHLKYIQHYCVKMWRWAIS